MNVNPQSEQFCETKPWGSLTDAEQSSGDWILLPDTQQARRKTGTDRLREAFAARTASDTGERKPGD